MLAHAKERPTSVEVGRFFGGDREIQLALCARSDRGQTGRYGMMLDMKRRGRDSLTDLKIGLAGGLAAALLIAIILPFLTR